MIDWMTAVVELPEHLRAVDWRSRAGYTLYAKPGGVVERVVQSWLEVPGSYDAGVRCRMSGAGLWISGNPIKFLTGQNVDGPDDAPALFRRLCTFVAESQGLPSSIVDLPVRLTRIDLTQSIDLGSVEMVRQALWVMGVVAHCQRQGRGQRSHSTVYFGKHSRRHALKCYCKADEISNHRPFGLPEHVLEDLTRQAAGLFRVEVTLRSLQLREDGLDRLDVWQDLDLPLRQWSSYWGRVEMAPGYTLTAAEMLDLPRRLRATYALWSHGADCVAVLSRYTYYRHRKALLSATGGRVDIAVLQAAPESRSADPAGLITVLRAARPWHASGPLAEWIRERAA